MRTMMFGSVLLLASLASAGHGEAAGALSIEGGHLDGVPPMATPTPLGSSHRLRSLNYEIEGTILQVPTSMGDPRSSGLVALTSAPNPFSNAIGFTIRLPRDMHVRLYIYAADGRRIVRLADRDMEAGSHDIAWHGIGEAGVLSGPGVYFAKLITPDATRVLKVVRTQ